MRSLSAKVCVSWGSAVIAESQRPALHCAAALPPGNLTREWDKRDQKYQFKFQITNLLSPSNTGPEIVSVLQRGAGYRWWCMSPSGPNVYRGIFHTDLLWLIFMTYIWAWHRHATPGEMLHCLVYADSAKVFKNSNYSAFKVYPPVLLVP